MGKREAEEAEPERWHYVKDLSATAGLEDGGRSHRPKYAGTGKETAPQKRFSPADIRSLAR
jgi:hypothetical protein